MTSTPDTADRRVGGLSRRRAAPDPAQLIAANRPKPPGTQMERQNTSTDENTGQIAKPAPANSADRPPQRKLASALNSTRTRRPQQITDHGTGQETDVPRKVTTYMRPSVRDRAAAAFKATAYLEEDDTWSHMVEKAVLAEVERREAVHNGGQPFTAGGTTLKRGRLIR